MSRMPGRFRIVDIQAHCIGKDGAYQMSIAVLAFLCLASPLNMLVRALCSSILETYLHHLDPLLQILRDFGSTFPAFCTRLCLGDPADTAVWRTDAAASSR
jgi:hypothetical protein